MNIHLPATAVALAAACLLGGATWLDPDIAGRAAIGVPKTQLNLGARYLLAVGDRQLTLVLSGAVGF